MSDGCAQAGGDHTEVRADAMLTIALRMLAWALAGLCFLATALVSPAPLVAPAGPPQAVDAFAAQRLAHDFRQVYAAGGEPRQVTLTSGQLASIGRLARHGLGWLRADGEVARDGVAVRLSALIGKRAAVNVVWRLEPRGRGLPPMSLRVGALRLPRAAIRLALQATLAALGAPSGDRSPDGLLDGLDIPFPGYARTSIRLPYAVQQTIQQRFSRYEGAPRLTRVMAHYAALMALQPAPGLGVAPFARVVNTAFANAARWSTRDTAAEEGRAAFVAIAMTTISPGVGKLAGLAPAHPRQCLPDPMRAVVLNGRYDLAQHWSLSGALTSGFSDRLTEAAGEWKELSDSNPGGSGFSFIDLTADRAGLRLAQAMAADPNVARSVIAKLAAARAEQLFPPTAFESLQEGLTAAQFRARYGDIRQLRYREAVTLVDRLLDQMPLYSGLQRAPDTASQ